jgi:hypothetical protein
MHLEMAHTFLVFAMRVIEVLFFTGLVGCATVIVISWISIFRDGFSAPRNKGRDSLWMPQHDIPRSAELRRESASLV